MQMLWQPVMEQWPPKRGTPPGFRDPETKARRVPAAWALLRVKLEALLERKKVKDKEEEGERKMKEEEEEEKRR